jgi:hypothetical protein
MLLGGYTKEAHVSTWATTIHYQVTFLYTTTVNQENCTWIQRYILYISVDNDNSLFSYPAFYSVEKNITNR